MQLNYCRKKKSKILFNFPDSLPHQLQNTLNGLTTMTNQAMLLTNPRLWYTITLLRTQLLLHLWGTLFFKFLIRHVDWRFKILFIMSWPVWNSKIITLTYFLCFRDNQLYIKYYMNIFQTMALGVVPFFALIFFNIRIYHRFRLTRGRFQATRTRGSTQVSYNVNFRTPEYMCS